jgi:DNA-binding CsgD family transcriptional regulator
LDTFVRGLVFRIRGDAEHALDAFLSVHTAAQRVKVLWRSALALIELDATPHVARGEQYLQSAALIVRENFPRSFLARRLRRWSQTLVDPIASKIAPQPRQVLRHVLVGSNPKEIAAAMGLSEDTVKGYMKTLFRAFSVNSTPQLLVACYERGIGSPSWWNALDEHGMTATRPRKRPAVQRRNVG